MLEFRIDERLQLRVPAEENAEEIYNVVRADLAHLKEWMIWATDDYEIESTLTFIRQNLHDVSAGRSITFSIFLDDNIVGGIGLNKFDREQHLTEIGYWISSACEGKGIITRCCRALIDHAFDFENMEKIEIRSSSANLRSRAVPERLGFTLDRIDKDIHPMPGGKFDDLAVYSITREVWESIRGSV